MHRPARTTPKIALKTALLAALCAAACACQPAADDATDSAAGAAPGAQGVGETDAGATGRADAATEAPGAGEQATVAMRYACDADTEVVVLDDGRARVALPDGQQVELSRITGSLPPVYAGGSLFFTAGDPVAYLSQGDRTNELACSPA